MNDIVKILIAVLVGGVLSGLLGLLLLPVLRALKAETPWQILIL